MHGTAGRYVRKPDFGEVAAKAHKVAVPSFALWDRCTLHEWLVL